MTTLNDFDRVLGEWLNEGPNRAPDRPIDLAVEHARSHPRRPDLIRFLRPDPMARPGPQPEGELPNRLMQMLSDVPSESGPVAFGRAKVTSPSPP